MFESFKNSGQSADRASGRVLGAQEQKGRLDSRQGGSLAPYLRHAAAPGERLDAQFQSGPSPCYSHSTWEGHSVGPEWLSPGAVLGCKAPPRPRFLSRDPSWFSTAPLGRLRPFRRTSHVIAGEPPILLTGPAHTAQDCTPRGGDLGGHRTHLPTPQVPRAALFLLALGL